MKSPEFRPNEQKLYYRYLALRELLQELDRPWCKPLARDVADFNAFNALHTEVKSLSDNLYNQLLKLNRPAAERYL